MIDKAIDNGKGAELFLKTIKCNHWRVQRLNLIVRSYLFLLYIIKLSVIFLKNNKNYSVFTHPYPHIKYNCNIKGSLKQ